MQSNEAKDTITRFSSLKVRVINLLGKGTDSIAFLVNDEWVFRFPLIDAARATIAKEIAFLPKLTRALSIEIPQFEYVGASQGTIYFVGYHILSGTPLSVEQFNGLLTAEQEQILQSLAQFLRELHAFPIQTAQLAGVKEEMYFGGYNSQQKLLLEKVSPYLSAAESSKLASIFAKYEDMSRTWDVKPSLLHSDLKPAHIMTSPSGKLGIIDWGDASIGDPDFDFMCLRVFFNEDIVKRLLTYFPNIDKPIINEKLNFFITLRWLQDAVLGFERYHQDYTSRLKDWVMNYRF